MDQNNTIIKYIIKSSPIGHLKETIENLKTVLGAIAIEDKEIQQEIVSYEEDHFKQISLNDDKILISKYSKDSEGYYHDQSKKYKISISPMSENIDKIVDIDDSNVSNPLRLAIDKKLLEYKEKNFKTAITATNSMHLLFIFFTCSILQRS